MNETKRYYEKEERMIRLVSRTLTNEMRNDILNILHENPDKLIYQMQLCNGYNPARSSAMYKDKHTICEFEYVRCSDVRHDTRVFLDSIENVENITKEISFFCNKQHRKIDNFLTERTKTHLTVVLQFSDYVFHTDKSSLLQLEVLGNLYNYDPKGEYKKSIHNTDDYCQDLPIRVLI